MAAGAQVDYDALAQQHGGIASVSGSGMDYDALAASHGGAGSNDSADPNAAIAKKYGLPSGTDLSKPYFSQSTKGIDPLAFSKAYAEANPAAPSPQGFFSNLFDEAKGIAKGMFSGGTGVASTPPVPGMSAVSTAADRFKQASTDPMGALGRTTTDVAAAALPFALDNAGSIWSKVSPTASVETALGRRLSVAEADTPRPGGQIQPALNNTPRQVLTHASQEGIKLTPGQATEDAMSQNLQKSGTAAAVGGKDLANALQENKTRFGQSVNRFMDKVDPKRAGMSAE